MKLSIISSAILCTLTVTTLVSCGSSDTSSTTSESTVVGTISGFGSIIMDNGVEHDTDGLTSCEVDDQAISGKCEDSLSTGMHVTLHTDANGDVTSVKYDDELEGAVSNVTDLSGTGNSGNYTFEVYGVTITTTSPETQWDDFSSSPQPPAAVDLKDAIVELSGEWQLDGTLLASYVEQQDAGDTEHEVKGTVGLITGTGLFPLTLRNGSTINVDGSALNPPPAEDDFVELKGSYIADVFIATDSEIEDEDDFDSDSEAEITGTLIANVDSSTGFSIGNTDVDISSASSCSNLVGFMVEAKGTYNQDTGVLVVRECENEDEELEAKCDVSNVTVPDNINASKVGSVECDFNGTTGGPLTIMFKDSPDLAMFSDDSTANPFDLTEVSPGDCVEIKFSTDAAGDYVAGLIEHEGAGGCGSYELEGTVDGFNDGMDITVLGIKFTALRTLYNALVNIGDKVHIADDNGNGNADKVEVEVE